MAKLRDHWWLLLLLPALLLPAMVQALQDTVVTAEQPLTDEQASAQAEGFALLADLPTKNQIPFFENRFRIDSEVETITLLMFRRPGSASVVLVRPDGSKLHFNTAEENQIRWHDAATYDLIEIKNPMPGPWQAIGRILPESRIMVLTDIKLDVDPLPDNLMVGETVKVTARLLNGGATVNARDFREVLTLEVIFISTNNAEFDNFGRGIIQVATFRDDGRGFDERARDGLFTGEFKLDFVAGEWTPKYIVRTALYTRELEQAPVILKPAPINPEVVLASIETDSHQVKFNVTEPGVEAASLLIQGRVRYPDGSVDQYALNAEDNPDNTLNVLNKGFGSYILETAVFGNWQDGREFMLTMPELSFVVNQQTFAAPELEQLPEQKLAELETKQSEPEPEPDFPWGLVIGINLFILIAGSIAIWLVMSGSKLSALMFWRKSADASKNVSKTSKATDNSTKNATSQTKAQKNNDLDDILDLSLPDD
ncbi:TIGR03503 family protein [Arsukibacterium tuosuense]|uniref:TIGR03503 family protein n=1 Tax=Arsukibacterium tuosuense TaxID=1323745 RepID=A0A285J5Z7_9GAMM|nr:TIGR03503 family protein [Arsukibacterium tuosuense]SNY55749.1 TIGR03503 family protein [Arsukibacterium tuosuense]